MNSLVITNQFADRFSEGGPFFMTLILLCLLLSIILLVIGFLNVRKNPRKSHKMLKLVVDASLLGLVIGFLASVIGLISAFDSVEAIGDPSPALFAGGLKVSLLTATFGLFSFIIARIGILFLRWRLNAEMSE
ncbi:MotA/TolQ/ExbB proton channel family protein [Winogradskyella luteola]|uniref:MotA/TolQ/ExbB proton channel family protein n=1 Tax=Winogradskyella luteola TaxID=2828330 RepID=A0A9X1FAI6_9FLAO|nr:MotA/TolQ/ExbB proton channel family protein [Winogradskyella luteola]MBV7270484.1 MotA/TolQ/ExbB proton channel family protein [Winogradskyella luteola]